jgi:hypothetical protein
MWQGRGERKILCTPSGNIKKHHYYTNQDGGSKKQNHLKIELTYDEENPLLGV